MPDLSTLGASLVFVLLVGVMLWFALGTGRNIRRGNQLLTWLQEGLPLLGRRTTLRWLGSSVVQLGIPEPNAPFRELEAMVVLEPRDLGALWAVAHRRGRRDFLIFRGRLARAPRFSAEVGDPRSWTMGDLRHRWASDGTAPGWSGSWGTAPVEARHDPSVGLEELRAWWERLAAVSGGVWRFTVNPAAPQLEIHLLPPAEGVGSLRMVEVVRQVAREIAAE